MGGGVGGGGWSGGGREGLPASAACIARFTCQRRLVRQRSLRNLILRGGTARCVRRSLGAVAQGRFRRMHLKGEWWGRDDRWVWAGTGAREAARRGGCIVVARSGAVAPSRPPQTGGGRCARNHVSARASVMEAGDWAEEGGAAHADIRGAGPPTAGTMEGGGGSAHHRYRDEWVGGHPNWKISLDPKSQRSRLAPVVGARLAAHLRDASAATLDPHARGRIAARSSTLSW